LVIGGSGSGKTRFFVKPNLMQMHSSYVVTDPKGTVLVECGRMLQRGRPKRVDGKVVYRRDDKGNYLKDKKGRYIPVYEPYKIKVFNTIDFAKSMHYNPFAYISKKNREKDILKFVEVLIKNTTSSQQPSGDDFWVKAEKLLYTAYIALIFAMYPEDQWNFETLIDMINNSECREDDEEFKNCIDLEFEIVECWLNGTKHEDPEVMADYGDIFETKPDAEQRRLGAFALKQFKAYKLAAGKTAKSYDELHLDKLGDELSALFIIISDTDATFNFLVAIMYSQLFNLLCTKADNSPGGKLDYHVRCLLDEFANSVTRSVLKRCGT
ncbi:MAG: type IV secretory system conjugative DNA transfer family protein, partial [Ruminococcus sp.]|nr:type IV secretory system conjugative DNA transfer family protein [Ruminococcus sp.]